ncbi:MAG: DUF4332 domain-containing protein [Anaerolineae bacterium]|nr:MAG: DUF4332 domain-containing protein [Anaerolineae bacterium]
MDEVAFTKFLKRSGKKPHVVEALVEAVTEFESYLSQAQNTTLDYAKAQDISDYVDRLDEPEVKETMRGLALYYQFTGNMALARTAGAIREQRIAVTRQIFKVREFLGVSADEISKLEAIGIITVEHMLEAGRTTQARQELTEQTGVPPEVILELVKLSDLSRLGAVKRVRARLYYDAGLDTPEKFAEWEPEALRQMLIDFVARTGFEGIPPLPKELRNAISAAQKLPKAVEYDS